jgi:hypothetical protein
MEERAAKKAIQELLIVEEAADKLLILYKEIKNEEEKQEFKQPLKEILMGCSELLDLMSKKYPHLDPHAEKFAAFDQLDENDPHKQRIMKMAGKAAEEVRNTLEKKDN